MLSTIEAINSAVNNFIWGVPAMICIIGVGLVLSFRTRFLQIRKFPYAMKVTFGRMFKKREASDGAMTPFQAVCTALAATVGTGNIAGVAGAIAIGGPGAVFWMWISAILGMCTKFSEVTLAVHFREKNVHGDLIGGLIAWFVSTRSKDQALNKARMSQGTLIASGFIAGGALMGVVGAILKFADVDWKLTQWNSSNAASWVGLGMYLALIIYFAVHSLRAKKEE